MKHHLPLLALAIALLTFSGARPADMETWGFFGHRRINRLAVFTLPPEMIGFFKQHIEFVTEHAVDPDKRRYATRHEAVRHYMDMDHWGVYPFPEIPRNWLDALAQYTEVGLVDTAGDTTWLWGNGKPVPVDDDAYRAFFRERLQPQYYEDHWTLSCADLESLGQEVDNCAEVLAVDRFSEYGILPYHLAQMQGRLTEAFLQGEPSRILRLATEMGHYIADAHVPLHTTENYNGQLTNQLGIHAFWESRLPELFADEEYDFFVGPAEYLPDPSGYYWDVVLSSHRLVDSVLAIERDLSQTFPQDLQYCYEERLDRTVRTQCREYARAYHERLSGQVESRMLAAIRAVGNAWYTAWVDAGKPNLPGREEVAWKDQEEQETLDRAYREGEQKGRNHE